MCGSGDIFQSIGNALADIDPGPAIGSALAEVDKTVNDAIPGGWITVGGLALGGAGLATGAFEGLAAGLAEGATAAEGTLAATGGITEGALAGDVFGGLAGTSGNLAEFAAASDAALGAGAGTGIAGGATLTPGADAILGQSAITPNLSSGVSGTFGSLNPSYTPGAFGSLSSALPEGVGYGTGLGGTQLGSTYALAGPGQFAVDAFGNPIQYLGGYGIGDAGLIAAAGSEAASGLSLADLNRLRQGYNLAKNAGLLGGGGGTAGRVVSRSPTGQHIGNVSGGSGTVAEGGGATGSNVPNATLAGLFFNQLQENQRERNANQISHFNPIDLFKS